MPDGLFFSHFHVVRGFYGVVFKFYGMVLEFYRVVFGFYGVVFEFYCVVFKFYCMVFEKNHAVKSLEQGRYRDFASVPAVIQDRKSVV